VRRTKVVRIRQPAARYLSAWQASYSDRGRGAPQATLSVFVFASSGVAAAGYRGACPKRLNCRRASVPGHPEIAVKAGSFRSGPRARCAVVVANRPNLLTRTVTCAAEKGYSFKELQYDGGFLSGVVFGKAIALARRGDRDCNPN